MGGPGALPFLFFLVIPYWVAVVAIKRLHDRGKSAWWLLVCAAGFAWTGNSTGNSGGHAGRIVATRSAPLPTLIWPEPITPSRKMPAKIAKLTLSDPSPIGERACVHSRASG